MTKSFGRRRRFLALRKLENREKTAWRSGDTEKKRRLDFDTDLRGCVIHDCGRVFPSPKIESITRRGAPNPHRDEGTTR
jgi:hypothetical protein